MRFVKSNKIFALDALGCLSVVYESTTIFSLVFAERFVNFRSIFSLIRRWSSFDRLSLDRWSRLTMRNPHVRINAVDWRLSICARFHGLFPCIILYPGLFDTWPDWILFSIKSSCSKILLYTLPVTDILILFEYFCHTRFLDSRV